MERPVKERLVGAAVLMAAAIILIPEMLSGPGRDESEERARAVADADGAAKDKGAATAGQNNAPIKTYTIDLSQSPGTSVAASEENRAPPPEEAPAPVPQSTSASDSQAKPESSDEPVDPPPAIVAATPAPADEAPVSPASAPVVRDPTPAPPPVASPPPRPLASSAAAPPSGGWAVQLGSFSKQATAERLMKDMRAQGHEAFVMPVKSGGATLYRVRIGPMKDRAGAEAALRGVKAKAPGAAVAAHP